MLGPTIYMLKQTCDGLSNRQGFVATVISTMSITLGALLCALTLAYVLIIKPLPYPDQEQLVVVKHHLIDAKAQVDGNAYTYPNLMHLYHQQQVFAQSALAFYSNDTVRAASNARHATAYVTPTWFELFGANIEKGRLFEASESLNTHQPVAVISHQTWQNKFAMADDILSKQLTINGISFRIIGVLAPDFIEPQISETGRNSDVFLPWDFNHVSERDRKAWGNDDSRLFYLAKYQGEMSLSQLSQNITTIVNSNWQTQVASHEFFTNWRIRLTTQSLTSVIVGNTHHSVYLLLAGVFGLLLIACTNIANLFLSRMAQRQQTLAIHAALGANQRHLFRLVLSETSVLMAIAMLFALAFSIAGFHLMQHLLEGYLPRSSELRLHGITLLCAVVICATLSFVFAKLNARSINYQSLNNNLQSSGKGTGIQVSRHIRQVLIASQICIVTLLVFINMSLFKDALSVIQQDDGFELSQLVSVRLSLLESERPSYEKRLAMMEEIRSELLNNPAIDIVSQSSAPLDSFGVYAMTIAGTKQRFTPQAKGIDHQYFTTIKQPIISGKDFDHRELKDQENVLIVNQAMARKLIGNINEPDDAALGMRLSFGGEQQHKIVGIVQDANIPGNERVSGRIYHPTSLGSTRLLLKLKPNHHFTKAQFNHILSKITSQYSVFEITNQAQRRDDIMFTQYTTAITSVVLAIITFLLTAIGLYGVLSYSTQVRQFELGTRQAIGAQRADIIRLVFMDNLRPMLSGLTVSIVLLVLLALNIDLSLVAYLTLDNMPLFLLTLALISIISGFACYWPLRPIINRPVIYSLRNSE